MNTDTDTDTLGRVLRAAVSDVDSPAGFAEAALRKGRRRRSRVRAALASAAVAVTVITGGVLTGMPAWKSASDSITPATDARLGKPTRGDLAGDAEFVDRARSVWRAELPDLLGRVTNTRPGACWAVLGEPHVYWAGRTADGSAAVVMQTIRSTPATCPVNVEPRQTTAVGLVGTDVHSRFHLLGVVASGFGNQAAEVFLFGPGESTVIALEESQARYVSPAPAVGPDGRVAREWQELVFRDGVATMRLDRATSPPDRLKARFAKRKPAEPGETVPDQDLVPAFTTFHVQAVIDKWIGNAGPAPYLGWSAVRGDLGGPRQDPAERARRFVGALNRGGHTDPADREPGLPAREGWGQPGGWHVTAELPDRRTVVLGEHLIGDVTHLFAVLWRGDEVDRVVPGGPVDGSRPLPVKLRLPDGQGWIVAHEGSRLRWRSGDGPWTALPGDAALLPEQATHVEVFTGGRLVVLPLA
ncbi:hypothetical protein [Allokutzneria albata]|uniref:Uncharacterized protein n=1 Tax=Allokutzneria albata TaxID=211114 RepID=A0A1G9SFA2_ALLAB|nr:hypothetical protein [Allokutzneria albata]SDM33977.1 hypothetical protein SAMN04489726_1121 [Allokutzneria albata]